MGRLIYSVSASLDGYHSDAAGGFAWAEPDDEVINALTVDAASVSTYLYGRRMYEQMAVWETDPAASALSPESAVVTERTRLEKDLTNLAVERAKREAAGDLTIEGPALATSALRLGLVDLVELLQCPVVVGGGTRVFPDGLTLGLTLTRERRFGNGMVQLSYDVRA